MKKIFFTLIGFLLLGISTQAQSVLPSFIKDSLDNYVEKALVSWQIPGVAVLIVKDGQVIVQKGYGYLERGKPEKVNENTLFMIASNTKAFTGTAMAMLEQQHKCSLDDKVRKYLPDFKMKDPWVAEHINLTDVMSHRIGMETFQGDFMYWESDLNSDEVIQKFGMLTPEYDFRTKWGYCNAGFLIAGKCLEQITGMTWDQFIRENLINPLEMNRTLVLTADVDKADNICAAHTLVGGRLQVIPRCHIDNLAPAASISSSVSDMSHWIIAQLDSGRYNGKQVIPWQAIRKAQYPKSIIRRAGHPFNRSHYSLYGMGWSLQDYEGRELISHTGGVDGFVTSVSLIPEEKLGVVVLTNTDMNGLYEALKWEIIDAYLGLTYRNYSNVFLPFFTANIQKDIENVNLWRDSVAMKLPTPVILAKFAGKYSHPVYGNAKLELKDDYLFLTLEHHPDLTAKLEYIGNNRFLCTYSSPMWGIKVFPFVIEKGKVKSFTLSVSDFLEFTTYDFVKD